MTLIAWSLAYRFVGLTDKEIGIFPANAAGTAEENGDVSIKVCEVVSGTPDYARVLVYYSSLGNPSCITSTPAPTPKPSPGTWETYYFPKTRISC